MSILKQFLISGGFSAPKAAVVLCASVPMPDEILPPPPPSKLHNVKQNIFYCLEYICQKYTPDFIKKLAFSYFYKTDAKIISAVIDYIQNMPDQTDEITETLRFLQNNPVPISLFSHLFHLKYKYKYKSISVFYDKEARMRYVLIDEKRMYMPSKWNIYRIKVYVFGVLCEQACDSPHKYEDGDFAVHTGDVVADIGAAEGIFALKVIERASKVYLFECDEQWVSPLKKTFAPYIDKVTIVNTLVSDVSAGAYIRLDDYFRDKKIDYIKADIEGAEINLVKGASSLLRERNIKFELCAYHRQTDGEDLQALFSEAGYAAWFSRGFMVPFFVPDFGPPYLRRVLIRAWKTEIADKG